MLLLSLRDIGYVEPEPSFLRTLEYIITHIHTFHANSHMIQIRLLGLGDPLQFLETVVEPPPRAAVIASIRALKSLGANLSIHT